MRLTADIFIYYIRDLDPQVIHRAGQDASIHGIKYFLPDEDQSDEEYIYAAAAGDLNRAANLSAGCKTLFIVMEELKASADISVYNNLPGTCVLIRRDCSCDYLINRLLDVFYFLTEWDKNMHIAALEGQGVQQLLDISEEILGYPAIAFDGTFDVVGYTKHTPCEYHTFQETVSQGYTDSETMSHLKKKQIFNKIQQDEMLVAPAADDDNRINIYLQFFSNQSLLGYICIFHEDTNPEEGYIDLIRLFMENMSLAMKKNYEAQRHGWMMYETFLNNMIKGMNLPENQIREQVSLIDGIEENGYFSLGVLEFVHQENIPLKFLARMLERQFWNIKLFLYEGQICLLKNSRESCVVNEDFFAVKEKKNLENLLSHYYYRMGVSNVFFHITQLKDALVQAKAALSLGKVPPDKTSGILYYRDCRYTHLFSVMESQMDVNRMKSDFYMLLSDYDCTHRTDYTDMLVTYFRNDCSPSRTADQLNMHRNSIRNMIHFIEEEFQVSVNSWPLKRDFLLSAEIDMYHKTKEESQYM